MSSFKPGWYIDQRIKQDVKFADAELYANKMFGIAANTLWHERQSKFESGQLNKHKERDEDRMVDEANAELKIRRNARLKQLYVQEAEQYEAELAARGLAIYKDRH